MSIEGEALDDLKAHAKSVVNEQRKKLKLRGLGRLKKGYPKSRVLCTLATSLEDCGVRAVNYDRKRGEVYLYDWIPGTDAPAHTITLRDEKLVRFCMAFDGGNYTDLTIPPTPIKLKKPGERKATVIE